MSKITFRLSCRLFVLGRKSRNWLCNRIHVSVNLMNEVIPHMASDMLRMFSLDLLR